MSLYIIPNHTKSTPEDVERYARHHDIGPHPNLRPLDGRPVSERVAEFERQIRLFEETFRIPARTVRNHCTAWAGYLDLVDVMERLGVQMDGNYFSGTYMKDRESAPYASFGAALPMRFCHPDGRLVNVYQQHYAPHRRRHVRPAGLFLQTVPGCILGHDRTHFYGYNDPFPHTLRRLYPSRKLGEIFGGTGPGTASTGKQERPANLVVRPVGGLLECTRYLALRRRAMERVKTQIQPAGPFATPRSPHPDSATVLRHVSR